VVLVQKGCFRRERKSLSLQYRFWRLPLVQRLKSMDYMIDHPQLASLWAANSRTIARKMRFPVGTVFAAAQEQQEFTSVYAAAGD
jgi:hypothetical protein